MRRLAALATIATLGVSALTAPVRAAAASYDWLVGNWTCQIDTEKWADMVGSRNGAKGVTLTWSWGDYGSGQETILTGGGHVTMAGRSTGAYYNRTWKLTLVSGDTGDSVFEGDATEDGHGKHRVYRLRNELIRTGNDELAEWRQVCNDGSWHAASSRHCALGRTPQGIVY